MKNNLARREFLRKMGMLAAAVPVAPRLLDAIVGSLLEKAYAETTAASMNPLYVNFTFPGAPPRWMCDLPLTPTGETTANFKAGNFGTLYQTVNGLSLPTYVAKPVTIGTKKVYLPPVWTMDLAKQDFSTILPHTMMIRGQDNLIAAHLIAARSTVSPIFGGVSLHGTAADGSSLPIPSILDSTNGVYTSQAFRSDRGFVATSIEYGTNPIASLLEAYKVWYSTRVVHGKDARLLEAQSLDAFDEYAQMSGITSSSMSRMYDNAIALVDANIYDSKSGLWQATYEKYLAIVKEAVQPKKGTLPGLFDKVIKPGTRTPAYSFNFAENVYVQLNDLRDMITNETTAPRMAENFAIAELTLDSLTNSLGLSFAGLDGLAIANAGAKQDATHDQHQIGYGTSTLVTTLFYRAFLGCMTEFVGHLKSKNMFDRTMLHVASEFNRVPVSATGSGHGSVGSNSLLISGMFADFSLIGNVKIDSPQGTWGVAAPYAVGKTGSTGETIQPKDVALTITTMLKLAKITSNGTPLTELKGGKWYPRWAEAKNV